MVRHYFRWLLLAFVFLISQQSYAQNFSFWKLGGAEKWWVIIHPAAAIKAKSISQDAIDIADSIGKTKQLPILKSGGEKDAIRHAVWMALLSNKIGVKKSLKLGIAHEKKNHRDFKKKRKEEGLVPDLRSVEMDLYNNEIGAKIFHQCKANCSKQQLLINVVDKLYAGKLRIIKMDSLGNSLNNEGAIIPQKQWEGKWENSRTIVPSNYNLDSNL